MGDVDEGGQCEDGDNCVRDSVGEADEGGSDDRSRDAIWNYSILSGGRLGWCRCVELDTMREWSRGGDAGGRSWNVGVSKGLLVRQRGWSDEDGVLAGRSVGDVAGDKVQLVEDAGWDELCESEV